MAKRRGVQKKRKGTGSGRTLWGATRRLPKDKKTKQPKRKTPGEIVRNSWLGNG